MKDEEMVAAVEMLLDDERYNRFVRHYLEIAKGVVVAHMWPYAEDASWEDVPGKYHPQTVEIAVYLVNRRGAEGETSHSESGVSRSYESAGVPASFMRGITPHVGVPS